MNHQFCSRNFAIATVHEEHSLEVHLSHWGMGHDMEFPNVELGRSSQALCGSNFMRPLKLRCMIQHDHLIFWDCRFTCRFLIMQDDLWRDQPRLAAVANCLEILPSADHRSIAAGVRIRADGALPGSVNQMPASCSICLEELDWRLPAEDKKLKITLPACLHSFHLKCLAEWRCKSIACPECRSKAMPEALDQMLLAGKALYDEDTWLGQTCRSLCEKVQAHEYPNERHSSMSMRDLILLSSGRP